MKKTKANKRFVALFLVLIAATSILGCGSDEVGGAITFYGEATLERTEPAFSFTRDLTSDEAKMLDKIVGRVDEWTDNSAVDRKAYYFNGSFTLGGEPDSVYYFSYEHCVLYYVNPIAESEYFAAISEDDMEYIYSLDK